MMLEFCISLISVSIMSGIAAIVILICKAIFGRRLSPMSHLLIWLPVIIRLLVTYIPKTKFSVYNYLPEEMEQLSQIFLPDYMVFSKNPIVMNIIPIIWVFGLIITAVIIIGSYIFFWINMRGVQLSADKDEFYVSKMLLPYEKIKSISEESKNICKLKRTPDIVVSKNIMSPMIAGFLCPKLVLPEKVLESFSEEQLKLVFVHEYTHYKKKDHIMNFLLLVLNILHWFNPIIWFAIRKIKKDNEDVCDEMVLKYISEDSRFLYGKTILDLTEYSSQAKISNSQMASTASNIKNRIKTIYSFSKRKFKVIILPLSIVITVTFLTGAITEEISEAVAAVIEKIAPIVVVSNTVTEEKADNPEKTAEPIREEILDPEIKIPDIYENTETPVPAPEPTPAAISTPTPAKAPEITGDIKETPQKIIEEPVIAAEQTPTPTIKPTPTPTIKPTATPTPAPKETPTPAKTADNSDKVLTYTASDGSVIASFSGIPSKSAFMATGNGVQIISVSINSSTQNSLTGTFNIIKDGVSEMGIGGRVSLNGSTVSFNSYDGAHNYSYGVN